MAINKKSNPRFFNHLLDCLNNGKHPHMLKYVSNSTDEFEITYVNKHINNDDLYDHFMSLFKDSEKYLEEVHGKEPSSNSTDCKAKFRANVKKCHNKYVQFISEGKDEKSKCKRVAKYRILKTPENYKVGATNDDRGRINVKKRRAKKKVTGKNSAEIKDLQRVAQESNNNMQSESLLQKNNTLIDGLERSVINESYCLCLSKISQNTAGSVPKVAVLKLWEVPKAFIKNMDAYPNLLSIGDSSLSVNNAQNVGLDNVIENPITYTNMISEGTSPPSIDNAHNIMEPDNTIENPNACTNMVFQGTSPPSMDNAQNILMEPDNRIENVNTYTYMISQGASAPSVTSAQNVPTELYNVIENPNACTNMVSRGTSPPNVDNAQNIMKPDNTIENQNAYTYMISQGASPPSVASTQNVPAELYNVIENPNACTNMVSRGTSPPSVDNAQNIMEPDNTIENLNAYTYMILQGASPPSVTSAQNVPTELYNLIENPNACTNMVSQGTSPSSMDNTLNMLMEPDNTIENVNTYTYQVQTSQKRKIDECAENEKKLKLDVSSEDILGEIDNWLTNFKSIY